MSYARASPAVAASNGKIYAIGDQWSLTSNDDDYCDDDVGGE